MNVYGSTLQQGVINLADKSAHSSLSNSKHELNIFDFHFHFAPPAWRKISEAI